MRKATYVVRHEGRTWYDGQLKRHPDQEVTALPQNWSGVVYFGPPMECVEDTPGEYEADCAALGVPPCYAEVK